jgi:hypothetical protein
MFNRGIRPASWVLGFLAAAARVAAPAATTYAAIPSANGVISACKDAKGGLEVIDAENGATCSANQLALSWNQQGPRGDAGATGAPGLSDVTWAVPFNMAVTATTSVPGTGLGAFYLDQGSFLISAKLNVEAKVLLVRQVVTKRKRRESRRYEAGTRGSRCTQRSQSVRRATRRRGSE